MKEWIKEVADMDIGGTLFASILTIIPVVIGGHMIDRALFRGTHDMFVIIVGTGAGIAFLGLLVNVLVRAMSYYIKSLSEGRIDISEKTYWFKDVDFTLNGLTTVVSVAVILLYALVVFGLGIFLIVPFSILLSLLVLFGVLVGGHFLLKLVFKVYLAIENHKDDPDAHKRR
jgi:hypothetical protein